MKMYKSVIFEKKNLKINIWKIHKVRDRCHYRGEYRGAAHSMCNLKYSVRKRIPIVFHNAEEELKKLFTCSGENTEKYITFSAPIEKEVTRIEKNGKKNTKNYILHFTAYW